MKKLLKSTLIIAILLAATAASSYAKKLKFTDDQGCNWTYRVNGEGDVKSYSVRC